MWELNHKEGWTVKNWCFWIVVLEKTLESSLESKEIKPVNPKGNQPWLSIGRADAEAAVIFWPRDANSWLIEKDPDTGKDWRREENGTTGWDGWIGSPARWRWAWVSSGSWWCHPTISSSVVPFSSYSQSFPASGAFPVSQLFTSGGQSIEVSASESVLPMNLWGCFPGLMIFLSKGLSRVFSSTTIRKHQFFRA